MKKRITFVIVFILFGVCAFSQVPQPPILISPPNGSGACPPVVLDWNDVPTAISYRLQISFNSTFSAIVLDQNTDSSKYTIPNGIISGSTNYYWRVNASNQFGPGLWSNAWSVIPVSQPVAPIGYLINDGNPVYADSNIVFYWSRVNFATSYRIQVINGVTNIINQIAPDTFFIAIPGTFAYNSTYYYRFAALNCAQIQGPWSSMWWFATGPLVVKNISSEVPTENKLYSNYPNPFNPSTKIKFSIVSYPHGAGGDLVLLKVYDVMGREIQSLVNEYLKLGTYEVTFDGTALTSGVYFYKLQSSDFVQTNRMVLIK
jgi:hypothetical protein